MIDFCDLSHWNSNAQAQECLKDSIVAIKATEGNNFVDKCFISRSEKFKKQTLIAYHFCRFDRNYSNVTSEVNNYLSALKQAKRSVIMALDFESPCRSIPRDLDCLYSMISQIYTRTGKEPYIYINASMLAQAEKLGYSFSWLWIAKWSNTPPTHPCGIWQYTNRKRGENLDGDYFMSDDISLLKRHEVFVK